MKLKEILEKRASSKRTNAQEKVLIQKLISKANDIIELSSVQLGHVSDVFKEFDKHNKEHSEAVLEIIEALLGSKAQKFSSHDLFALIAVSYLHDCGMAVSDYEMEVLKMVEGKLDGQKPKTTIEAKQMIRENLNNIYGPNCNKFTDAEIQNWIFVPVDEETLVGDFAELLTDYQDYRNGRIDDIKASEEDSKKIEDPIKANEVKFETNSKIRIDYLRITHHLRIEKYIKNWGKTKYLKDFPIVGIGQQIADDIAACCKAHGEDDGFLNQLNQKNYSDGETSNLQFVAIMLRLGDILHYSYDRAHPALRALHHFQSEYSYNQWRLKADNGLRFIVKNGKISCSAYCELARDYYDIINYVKAIEHELALYNRLSPKWKDFPKIIIQDKVNLDDLDYNKEKFQPVPGLKFTLEQNKVLDLLMGAKLYTDEYACLRELYQNSLDACRCQIAKDAAAGRISTGRIEFGLGEGNGRKYVYCLDNGKGMTKDIIEKYLLNIGSSYYRSSDFFKKQAETGADFTPTSQFGIGMLSCFMIGNEIEITTHEEGSKDGIISCVMEGPNEYFYYKIPSREDAEKVPTSGTLVKVFLNKKFRDLLNDDPLKKLGYLLWHEESVPNESMKKDINRWKNHLYQIMNTFVLVVPNKVNLVISLQNLKGRKEFVQIYNKPLPIAGELRDYAEGLNELYGSKVSVHKQMKELELDVHYNNYDARIQFFRLKKSDYLEIQVQENGLECRMIFEIEKNYLFQIYSFLNIDCRCCVDGISVWDSIDKNSSLYHFKQLGVLNFIGENRPQLSVNREELINVKWDDYERKAKVLLEKLINESIAQVCNYIKYKEISPNEPLYSEIWNRLLEKFGFCIVLLYTCLKNMEACHNLIIPSFNNAITFRDYLISNETILPKNRLYLNIDPYSLFYLLRLFESDKIELKNEDEIVITGHSGIPSTLSEIEQFDVDYLLLNPLGYDDYWSEYDMFQYANLSIVSDKLMKGFRNFQNAFINKECIVHINWIYSASTGFVNKLISSIRNQLLYSYILNPNISFFKVDDSLNMGIYGALVGEVTSKIEYCGKIRYLGLFLYIDNSSVLVFIDPETRGSICVAKRGKCKRHEFLNFSRFEYEWIRYLNDDVLFLDGTVWNPWRS